LSPASSTFDEKEFREMIKMSYQQIGRLCSDFKERYRSVQSFQSQKELGQIQSSSESKRTIEKA